MVGHAVHQLPPGAKPGGHGPQVLDAVGLHAVPGVERQGVFRHLGGVGHLGKPLLHRSVFTPRRQQNHLAVGQPASGSPQHAQQRRAVAGICQIAGQVEDVADLLKVPDGLANHGAVGDSGLAEHLVQGLNELGETARQHQHVAPFQVALVAEHP